MEESSAPLYGQVVIGPPASGKTTYCNGMQQYLKLLGRDAKVINLDPANEAPTTSEGTQQQDGLPYDTLLDVCEEVVNLSSVMKQLELGPNGGLVYCMEYLEAHAETIIDIIAERVSPSTYLLLDLPGQVELYTHGTAVQHLLQKLIKRFDLRLCMVQLVDSHCCTDATKFISAALLGTTSMLRLELPTVNVLSKIDLLSQYGELPFALDYFTDCRDLGRLVPFLHAQPMQHCQEEEDFAQDAGYQEARAKTRHSAFFKKHARLHEALAEVVDDYGLLSFMSLNISDAESVGRVLARIDKCNGHVFVGSRNASQDLFQCAVQQEEPMGHELYVQERYPETIPELEPPSDQSAKEPS